MLQDFQYLAEHLKNFQNSLVQVITFNAIIITKELFSEYLKDLIIPSFLIIIRKNLLYKSKNLKSFYEQLVSCTFLFAQNELNLQFQYDLTKLLLTIEGNKKISKVIDFPSLKNEMPEKLTTLLTNITLNGLQKGLSSLKQIKSAISSEGLNQIFTSKLDKLSKHEIFNKHCELEIEDMVAQVIKIDRITKNQLKTVSISFDAFSGQMIKLMDPKQVSLPHELSQVSLKLFRKIIEKENLEMYTPSADWDTKDYILYAKKIKKQQNELVRLKLEGIVFDIIQLEEVNFELKHEAILVGISLLLDGNENTQRAFYERLQNDTKNNFISQIKLLIDNSFNTIKKFSDQMIKYRVEILKQNLDENFLQQNEQSFSYEKDLIIKSKRIFRFLQLFCEGHNFEMQSFIGCQIQEGVVNGKSLNMINHTSIKFGVILKSLCFENIDLVGQIIDFLIESVQGPCPTNQETLTNSKIVDFCSELLTMFNSQLEYQKRGFDNENLKDQVTNLVSKSTKLLLSLVEGNTTITISQLVAENLEMSFIKKRLVDVYKKFVQDTLKLDLKEPSFIINRQTYEIIDFFQGPIADAFDMYILLATLADLLKPLGSENLAEQILHQSISEGEVEQNAIEFFRRNTGSVEVYFQKRLIRVFFPVDPTCRNLSKLSRTKLMSEVKRNSPNDKITGLVNNSEILFSEMHHMSWLQKLPFHFTATRLDFFRDISTIVALLINIFLIFVVKRDTSQNVSFMYYSNQFQKINTDLLITVLGFIQLVTSSLMLIFWIVINTPIILTEQWNILAESNKLGVDEKLDAEIDEVNRDPTKYTTNHIQYLFLLKGPYSVYFQTGGKMNLGSLFAKVLYYTKSIIFLCAHPSFIYMFFYIIISIIAVIQSEILYCFHLLDIINRNEMLKNVIRSITGNFRQLALTLLLMSIVIYIFALIGYNFFADNFYNYSTIEDQCNSVFGCFLTTLQYGLRNGGGIAESLKIISFQKEYNATYWARFAYDVTFCIMITIVFLNIVFGIIIDTFAELRDEKHAMIVDMNSKCYICGLDRYQFEKNADGFKNHIDRDHDLWNYLYYLHYLEYKDATEYNGIESLVANLQENHDIGWFPIMKAISIREDNEGPKFADEIREINLSMAELKEKFEMVKDKFK